MQSAELRRRFLEFFRARGHAVTPSDGLVPSGDPTVLFTSAGMNQFKDSFLGKRTDVTRAASCQKCLRTGDLERVGQTAYHHTFFEMLGNFSFGDYFKADAIRWGWEFLTGTTRFAGAARSDTPDLCLRLPADRLWVSIYEEDGEALRLWRDLGIPAERIVRLGQADNFWPANAPVEGPDGPCGPCSELYYDPEGTVRGPRSVEVWNLVFTQFDRQSDGQLRPLPRKNIDTGMGLERLASVIQGAATDYEVDLFAPIMAAVRALSQGAPSRPSAVFAQRAIADHLRAVVFLIAEGVLPSNESRGYVLRMLIRRAHRLGRATLGVAPTTDGFLASLIPAVEEALHGSPYAQALVDKRAVIRKAVEQEERQFMDTLDAGTNRLNELLARYQSGRVVPGPEAFKLYDTYGFPVELTEDVARERGMTVEREGFARALQAQRERSRAGSQFSGGVFVSEALQVRQAIADLASKDAQFIGYNALEGDSRLRGIWDGARWVDEAREGQELGLVLDRSPFYGESGGQVGDAGLIEGPRGTAQVDRTAWIDDVLVHRARVRQGTLRVHDPVRARVDADRRLKIARSHTATHLLHWALRTVLGSEAGQAGSLVEVDRLRFDVTCLQGLSDEQRFEVETLVNRRVQLADPVATTSMPLAHAKQVGALAMFGEQYGAMVRVVTIGDYSRELCGGTHVTHTGFVGTFRLTSESAIAAGTRRLEALVGEAATADVAAHQRVLRALGQRLGRPALELVEAFDELLERIKSMERGRKQLQQELAVARAGRLRADAKQIDGVALIAAQIDRADRELLSVLADAIKRSLDSDGIVLLASSEGPDQVAWVMATTPALSKRVHAGQLLKSIAAITQGGGGGRPEFAQAGGKDPSKIAQALARGEALIREALTKS